MLVLCFLFPFFQEVQAGEMNGSSLSIEFGRVHLPPQWTCIGSGVDWYSTEEDKVFGTVRISSPHPVEELEVGVAGVCWTEDGKGLLIPTRETVRLDAQEPLVLEFQFPPLKNVEAIELQVWVGGKQAATVQTPVSLLPPAEDRSSLWDLERLYESPNYQVLERDGNIWSLLYENEPYLGKPTQVFAYLGFPEDLSVPVPAMVLVHGGGGTAFKEWVQLWNNRGYAAIAMDLGGCGPNGQPLPDGGPRQDNEGKFFDLFRLGWENTWTYQAVAACIRASSLLRSFPVIDPERIGVTGISWGGYLVCLLSALDPRFACAISVYGAGFLQVDSQWSDYFACMTVDQRIEWHQYCDPASFLSRAQVPLFLITGTTDQAYPLNSHRLSYSLIQAPVTVAIKLGMRHSHEAAWEAKEVYLFADSILKEGPAFPQFGELEFRENEVRVPVMSIGKIQSARLLFTMDEGPWKNRDWNVMLAQVEGNTIKAPVLPGITAYLIAVTDASGAYVSTHYVEP